MAMTDDSEDNFEVALARLAISDKLIEVRKNLSELESRMYDAVDREDYAAAARLRDQARELRAKDPEALISSIRAKLDAAVKAEEYTPAAGYASQLRELKLRFLTEYRLAGRWQVERRVDTAGDRLG